MLGEMIQFDYDILFKRVETTNYESLDACCILGVFFFYGDDIHLKHS